MLCPVCPRVVLSIHFCSFCLYYKNNITHGLEDMNFMFSWQKQNLTSERTSCHRYISWAFRHQLLCRVGWLVKTNDEKVEQLPIPMIFSINNTFKDKYSPINYIINPVAHAQRSSWAAWFMFYLQFIFHHVGKSGLKTPPRPTLTGLWIAPRLMFIREELFNRWPTENSATIFLFI